MKYNSLPFILGMLILGAGCAKESAPQENDVVFGEEFGDAIVDISMPDGGIKTILGAKSGDTYPVYWQTGDKVSMNGVLSSAVPETDNRSNKTSLYVKDVSLTSPFNILYPGEADVSDKVTFPVSQNYTANSFDANSLPMYATAANLTSGFTMNYLGAVLCIPVKFTAATVLKQITLTAVNGEPLGGTFTIGKTSGALNGELSPYSTVSTLYYSFGESGTNFAANATVVFYIAIPKGTYSKGIEMKVYDTEGNYMKSALFTDSNSVQAGKVYEFTQRVFNPDGTAYFIETVDDLQNFALRRGGAKFSLLEAIVIADIDMTGQEYKADNFNFYGTLDGGGHTITGLTKPLFNNIKGSVKNLILNSTITEPVLDGCNNYGLGILARYAYVSSSDEDAETGDYGQVIESVTTKGSITVSSHEVEHDFSVGGMLGANKGIPMNSCVNEASVSVSGITPSTDSELAAFRAGGLVGSAISADADISGCSNTGAVTVNGVSMENGSGIVGIGGLVGYVTKDDTIETSTNSGAVSVNNITSDSGDAPYLMVGGIVGNVTVSSGFKISDCENLAAGTVTLGSSCNVQSARVGGVIGRIGSEGTTVKDCINRAAIGIRASSMSSSPTYGGIVGAVLADGVNLDGCKNYGQVKNEARRLDAIGGIVGYHNQAGSITGCENHGEVLSTAQPQSIDQYFGGIIGKKAAGKAIGFSSCTNAGDVTVSCSAGHSVNIHMGGIIGGCPGGSSTFSNCSNSGNLTNSSVSSTKDSTTPAVSIGGVIGRVTDNDVSSITDCTNSGDINNNCAASNVRIGGILGYAHQAVNNLSGCTNSGLVSNNVLSDSCYVRIGGIIGYSNAKVTMSSTNTNTGTIQNNANKRVVLHGFASESQYDDNVRIGGCIADHDYNNAESVYTNQKNEGEIVNQGSESCGWVYMGGLQGYARRDTYKGAQNGEQNTGKGYVHNEGTVRDKLYMAGLVARTDPASTDGTQRQTKIQSSCKNYGNVYNNGSSNGITFVAGLVAQVGQSTEVTGSTNYGTIKNVGYAAQACFGGVCGKSEKYVSLDGSTNEGDVIFEGTTSENAVFLGGIIASCQGSRNSIVRNNTNSGAISCNVAVPKDLEIGGVVADASGKVSSGTNEGPISINANVGGSLYVGGVVGYIDTYASNTVTDCENKASGTITCADVTITNQIFCGGVIGGEKNSVAVSRSNLVNRAAITLGSSGISTANTAYSYIGGVVGGNGDTTTTYSDCENYGSIYYKGGHKCRCGGIVSFTSKVLENMTCRANVRFVCTKGGTAKSDVGGIAGFAKGGTHSNLLYKGDLNTNSSSPRAYTGSLVGRQNSDVCTFKDCKVGGSVKSAGSVGTNDNCATFVCCTSPTAHDINIDNLIIETGTKRYSTTVTEFSLNYNATGKYAVLVSGTTSETNTTTLNPASTGSMTNCSFGSID